MVSKIDKLSMEKIMSQVGFPYNIKELRSTYKYNVSVDLAIEFEKNILQAKNFKEIQRLVVKYEGIFDKNVYVLHLGRLLEKDLESQKRQEILAEENDGGIKKQVIFTDPKTTVRRGIVNAKNLLKDVKVADIGINSETGEIIVYTSKEFVDQTVSMKKKVERTEKRLEQIEEKIGLEEVLKYISPSDLITICDYPNLGNILAISLYKNKSHLNGEKINGENNGQRQGNEVVDSEIIKKGNIFDWDEFEETVKKYSSYIDLDKMLLLANSVFYNKYGNEFYNFSSEEAGELQDFTKKIGELIERKKVVVSSPRFNTDVTYQIISESVESLNKHFINGKYYEYEELAKLVEDIINGTVPVSNISKREYQNTLKMNIEELLILDKNNPNAIQYLIDNDMLEKIEIEEFLKLKSEYTDEQALYFINLNFIPENSILDLYNSEKLTLENLRNVKLNLENRTLNEIVSVDRLVELYLEPNKKEEFEKYRKLFKLLIIDESRAEVLEREIKKDDKKAIKELDRRILNRRKAIGISVLEKSIELLNDEHMYDLYHKGILQIDTVIDYVGFDAVNKLFASGELKPIDVKRLFNEKILTEQMLEEIFRKNELTETQKLVLIYSTFSSEQADDEKMRKKFISCMSERTDSVSEPAGQVREKKEEKGEETQEKQNKNITDPWTRWNLISSLDKDYSQEYLKDGYIIFYLPNMSKYIIEKLYDKNNEPAYGAATYILDESVFKENQQNIVKDKNINKSYLVSLNKNKTEGVKKLVHTGWGNAIVKYFEVEESSRYTEEEIIEIKANAEKVEKSKRPMTRDDD